MPSDLRQGHRPTGAPGYVRYEWDRAWHIVAFPLAPSPALSMLARQLHSLDSATLELLWHDADAREVRLRRVIIEALAARPAPALDEHIVATYFLALRGWSLEQAAKEISYHATSGTKDIPPGSLLEQCTGKAVGTDAFDSTSRLGLLHMSYPLKMMLQPDGHLTSTDILHTVAGAILFAIYENQDVRLVRLGIPENVARTFPGPAHGSYGLRQLTGFGGAEPAFGTIVKPTAGILPETVGALVEEAAACPSFSL
jgi:ribulose-bisphosphate carboxylase large chain